MLFVFCVDVVFRLGFCLFWFCLFKGVLGWGLLLCWWLFGCVVFFVLGLWFVCCVLVC